MSVFNDLVFNSDVFLTDGDTPPVVETVFGGHFVDDHARYRRYREQLERLVKVYEERDSSKYVKNITEVVEISEDLEVPTLEITAAASALQDGRLPQIDYDAFVIEINKLLAFIEKQITLRQSELESDDELALLLLM